MRGFSTALLAAATLAAVGAYDASAATITNKDAEMVILVVSEAGNKIEVAIGAGGSQAVCPNGCFITTPSGDHIGLDGGEDVDIVNGSAVVK